MSHIAADYPFGNIRQEKTCIRYMPKDIYSTLISCFSRAAILLLPFFRSTGGIRTPSTETTWDSCRSNLAMCSVYNTETLLSG